ncbi:MAG: hypothetical protein JJT94_16975 [Bernardetiaceae bacterium]|nr:hypothetical protein [Bernardetiaceae bacterium]
MLSLIIYILAVILILIGCFLFYIFFTSAPIWKFPVVAIIDFVAAGLAIYFISWIPILIAVILAFLIMQLL